MRILPIVAASAIFAGLFTSSAYGSVSLNFTKITWNTKQDAVLVRALNDGAGGTGTKLDALNLTFKLTGTSEAYFFVDDTDLDGSADQVQITNPATNNDFSYVRLGTSSDTFIVGASPSKNVVQPNPWLPGVNTFTVAATTLNASDASTGSGAAIARLIIDKDAGFTVTGSIGGDIGLATAPQNNIYIPPPVPEPASLALVGFAGWIGLRRRK